jgi:hypothetical protein
MSQAQAKRQIEMTNAEWDAYQAACAWSVVTDPDTAHEYVEGVRHPSYKAALKQVEKARSAGIPADVAKRLPDGTITYEF